MMPSGGHLKPGVLAAHLRIPSEENPARVLPAYVDVEAPESGVWYQVELLTQQGRRGFRCRVISKRHDVLNPDEPQLPVLLRLVQQELRLEQVDRAAVSDEGGVAVVESHRAEWERLQARGELNRPAGAHGRIEVMERRDQPAEPRDLARSRGAGGRRRVRR